MSCGLLWTREPTVSGFYAVLGERYGEPRVERSYCKVCFGTSEPLSLQMLE